MYMVRIDFFYSGPLLKPNLHGDDGHARLAERTMPAFATSDDY
jgi:hypothetical protein